MDNELGYPVEKLDEMLVYLDTLRESGVTNMFGAAPYVAEEFDIPKTSARKILGHWMKTYSERHPS